MFCEDIAQILVDGHFGTIGGTNGNIFFSSKAKIPIGPGPYISLIDTGGLVALRTQNRQKRPAYDRPAAQVIIRASDFLVARQRANEAYKAIYSVRNQFVNQIWYQEMLPLQLPFDGQTDDQNRLKMIFNVRAVSRAI